MIYYFVQDETTIITHDGNIQLGIFHDLNLFKNNENFVETYWYPDTYNNRYKRINFQRHLIEQAKLPKENKEDDVFKHSK